MKNPITAQLITGNFTNAFQKLSTVLAAAQLGKTDYFEKLTILSTGVTQLEFVTIPEGGMPFDATTITNNDKNTLDNGESLVLENVKLSRIYFKSTDFAANTSVCKLLGYPKAEIN